MRPYWVVTVELGIKVLLPMLCLFVCSIFFLPWTGFQGALHYLGHSDPGPATYTATCTPFVRLHVASNWAAAWNSTVKPR